MMLNTGGRARQRQRVLVGGGAHTQTASGRSDIGADERRDQSAGAAVGRAARLVAPERHRPMVRQQTLSAGRGGEASRDPVSPVAQVGAVCPYGRQRPARCGRQGGAFPLRQPTPNAVPFAVLDRVGGALADHRASAADCLRACFSGVPLGRAFPIGRKEHCAIDMAAGSPQPPRPQRRCSCVLKRFLPSVHLLPRNDDHAGASAPRSEASTRQWDEPTDSPVGWSS